jgi:hypothetical protein
MTRWTPCPDCAPTTDLLVLQDAKTLCRCKGTGIIDSYTGSAPEARYDIEAALIRAIQEKINK